MLVQFPWIFYTFTRLLTTLSADLPQRATFRSTLSQPSQMGNFKHQSIRTSERERDKDADRDRERDLRDKEGQERLRSVGPLFHSRSPSDSSFSFPISTTEIASLLLQVALLSEPESGILPLT